MFESKVGMIPIAKPVVIRLFDKMTNEEIIEMAKSLGKSVVYDIALFMKNRVDLDSFLSWLELRMKHSSIEISHNVEDKIHCYVFKHELGENWSLYHKTILELIFHEILNEPISIETTKTTITLKFRK